MVQGPTVVMCTRAPVTEQLPVAVKVTGWPEAPPVALTVMVWAAFWAVVASVTWVAAEKLLSPAWLNVTVQMPVPLVIVIVLPLAEQAPAAPTMTGDPEPPPVAATLKLVLYTALGGACCVTVSACAAFWAVVVSVTGGAAL